MKDFDFLHAELDSDDDCSQKNENKPYLILVEDDLILGKTIKAYLGKTLDLPIKWFKNPKECLDDFQKEPLEKFCLLTDISFDDSGIDGLRLIDLLKEKKSDFVSIVMTGFASIEGAILATKKGVYHYLTKPFELEVLKDLIVKAVVSHLNIPENQVEKISSFSNSDAALIKKGIYLKNTYKIEKPSEGDFFNGIVGRSLAMKRVFERISKVAKSDSTILITGPSGTGKELVAKAIHHLSTRDNSEMVSVNCGAIPGELLESELFGHVKGAFTGAISDKKGRFELAHNGTIFLDEIGDMPLLLQIKILRVLQSREFEKVGGVESKCVDARIITATHRDLDQAVLDGNFREDLYYRLNVIPINLPSLAERKEDIPLLISYFRSRYVSADGRNNIDFNQEALDLLMNYSWPGNVRELENLIERLVILKGGNVIKADDLPEKFLINRGMRNTYHEVLTLPDDGIDLKGTLQEIENSLISQALERTKGNKNRASKLLSLNRTTLIEKLRKRERQSESTL